MHRLQRALHVRDNLFRPPVPAHDLAEVADRVVNFLQVARVNRPDRHARLDQVGRELVLHVGRGDDQIGLQPQDRLHIARAETAHPRLGVRRPAAACKTPSSPRPAATPRADAGYRLRLLRGRRGVGVRCFVTQSARVASFRPTRNPKSTSRATPSQARLLPRSRRREAVEASPQRGLG